MTGSNGVEYISVCDRFADRGITTGGMTMAELVQRAKEAVAGQVSVYLEARERDLAELEALVERLKAANAADPALSRQLFDIAHDVKGQGATFGYELVTDIADSLCRSIEKSVLPDAPNASWTTVIATHVRALRLVIGKDIQGSGGPSGAELLAGLKAAASKLSQSGTPQS